MKAVASEDSAAVVGHPLAAIGIGLHQATGSAVYDAAASIVIGVLLAWIAYALGRDTKDLLIGEAADPELRLDIQHTVAQHPEVDAVLELLTMQLSPDDVLVAMRVDFAGDVASERIEQVSTEIERELQADIPSCATSTSTRPPRARSSASCPASCRSWPTPMQRATTTPRSTRPPEAQDRADRDKRRCRPRVHDQLAERAERTADAQPSPSAPSSMTTLSVAWADARTTAERAPFSTRWNRPTCARHHQVARTVADGNGLLRTQTAP